jgi:hypothetical protein
MSYIQLNIGGKLRGLKFNQMAVITMTKNLDFDNMEASYGYALIYAGLVSNMYVKRQEVDFSFEEVCDWADELKEEDLTKIREAFESTTAYQKLAQQNEVLTKKKLKKAKDS